MDYLSLVTAEEAFENLRNDLIKKDNRITSGKMMSAEAIRYDDKVFAFFSKEQQLVLKLGKDFDRQDYKAALPNFNPFKNKPAMKARYELDISDYSLWEPLTEMALNYIKTEK